MTAPALIIFDCDGVLVDSEPIANRVLVELLAEHGLSLTLAESARRFRGRRMDEVIADAEQSLGRSLPSDWLATYESRRNEAFARDLRPIPGIRPLLQTLTLPTCVASSGSVSKMRMTLGLTGLAEFFGDRLFTSWDVPRGKPFPDVFLHAAGGMGVAPNACVVVEDSPAGAAAAQAAGMRCLGYAADADPAALQAHGAEPFFAMEAIPALLGVAHPDPHAQGGQKLPI